MRSTFALALGALLAIGCSDGGSTASTDSDPDTDPEGITSAERLGVPDEFEFLWNTQNGCETGNGPGTQVYWHTADAESTDNGNGTFSFKATETWYWFNGDNSPDDCKDVWELRGQFYTTDYSLLGCAGCEEAYTFTRTLKEGGCNIIYSQLYGYDEEMEPPDPQVYSGFFLFDTHIEFDDSPNEDDKLLVVARYRRPDNRLAPNNNYSSPAMSTRFADDTSVIGPPGRYTWVGQACVGSGGGGGT
jgi:hypothetical protein